MIQSDEGLKQTFEQMELMYRSLAQLREKVLPKNPGNFALMAEGPLEQIRRLRAEIDAYCGATIAEENDADVWIRIQGADIQWPDTPTSVLTAFLDNFRKGVQEIAEFLITGGLTTRPTKELKRACDLRVVAFQHGSLRVGIRVPGEEQLSLLEQSQPAPVHRAFVHYLSAAAWVGSDAPENSLDEILRDAPLRRITLNALKRFVPRPRGDVEFVEIAGRTVLHGATVRLTRQAHTRIDHAIDHTVSQQVETHRGELREIDLDGPSFILRNLETLSELKCTFDEALLETAKEALDRRVQVTGIRQVEQGRRFPPLHVTRLEIIDEDEGRSE